LATHVANLHLEVLKEKLKYLRCTACYKPEHLPYVLEEYDMICPAKSKEKKNI
jgi:hypothetical protein